MSGHLIHGQPTKKAKFNDVVLHLAALPQSLEGLMKPQNIHLVRRGSTNTSVGILLLCGPTTTLVCFPRTGLIYQNLSYSPGRHGQEMLP